MKKVFRKAKYLLLGAAICIIGAGFRVGTVPTYAATDHTLWQHGSALELTEQTESLDGGNYYLSRDITLQDVFLSVTGTVELCLNGFQLTLAGYSSIEIISEASLTLWDCETGVCGEAGHTHKGLITGATGGAIAVNGGTFTMYGGTIAENTSEFGAGGVTVNGGTFTMYGGTISGNQATAESNESQSYYAGGGGIYAESGSVVLNGGTISGNSAANGYGGGVFLNATQPEYDNETQAKLRPSVRFSMKEGVLIADNTAMCGGGVAMLGQVTATMSGGVIGGKAFSDGTLLSGNRATETDKYSDAGGGGVFVKGTSLDLSQDSDGSEVVTLLPVFTMSDGVIGYEVEGNGAAPEGLTGNSAQYGAGVHVADNGKFEMSGGEISHNEGAGVAVTNNSNRVPEQLALFRFSAGTIADNTQDGVYCETGGTLEMSGSATVSGSECGLHDYSGGILKMSGGTVTGCTTGVRFEAFMNQYSSMGGDTFTATGGSITGNSLGVDSGAVTLGGTISIQGNFYQDGQGSYSQNLMLRNRVVTLLAGFAGDVGVTLEETGGPFTSGYQTGMERYFTFDGLSDGGKAGKISVKEVEVYDSDSGSYQTVNELALTYRITFSDAADGREIEGASDDFIAGATLRNLLYDTASDQSLVLKEEIAARLVKQPDETNHYRFSEFLDEERAPIDFEGYLSLTQDTVLYVSFAAEAHSFGSWSRKDENEHTRSCGTCNYAVTEAHDWGNWSADEGGETHSRTCQTDGCGEQQTLPHDWGDWSADEGGETHSRTCQTDGCGETQTLSHDWGDWSADEGGETHSRSCQTEGCGEEQTLLHDWGEWRETEGETHTRDCDTCGESVTEAYDKGQVVAVLFRNGVYTPYYRLQTAFDDASESETVYFVLVEGSAEIGETLVLNKNVLFGGAVRSVGADGRADYTTVSSIVLKRAEGFDGVMIRISLDVGIVFENLSIEGGSSASPAVEVYGVLTITGGSISAECAIRVCVSPEQGHSLLAVGENAGLFLSGSPVLGEVRLENPAGSIVPAVDLTGFTGELDLRVEGDRPYGVFASGVEEGATVHVLGGAEWTRGLSARGVRTQDNLLLCGGYDLEVTQTALGEITITGTCDEYLGELTLSVNGKQVVLAASDGSFSGQNVDMGSEIAVEIAVGEGSSSIQIVSYDEKTGQILAPENASYPDGAGGSQPLNGADPLAFALGGDSFSVLVNGETRTLDFCRPVHAAFVDRYLTDGEGLLSAVDYTNFERVKRGQELYARMTERQKGLVDETLSETSFGSFAGLLEAVEEYVEEQDLLAKEFLDDNETLNKEFDDVSASDKEALADSLESYRGASEEQRHFLDEQARDVGYSGFEGMVDDLIAKSEFETEREETLENLGTILRGCDGKKVREELTLSIVTVEEAVYERCTDDDFRLEYLAGRKESLAVAVRVLENLRAEERAQSTIETYLKEKTEGGCYSEDALNQIGTIAREIAERLSLVDPEREDGERALEEILSDGLFRLDGVHAHTVASGNFGIDDLPEYEGSPSELNGFLMQEGGFAGNSRLRFVVMPLAEEEVPDCDVLFRLRVLLDGDELEEKFTVTLLLPGDARGYEEYTVVGEDGSAVTVAAENDRIVFEANGTELVVAGRKLLDLRWLVLLLSLLLTLETAALGYCLWYCLRRRTAAFVPLLLAVPILPVHAAAICIALAAAIVAETAALAVLIRLILKRERNRPESES